MGGPRAMGSEPQSRHIQLSSSLKGVCRDRLCAVRIESRTNLLFSFEKMVLRDAVKSDEGAELFARGLFQFLHGAGESSKRFEDWCDAVGNLPRRQTRVLTWPVVTVFGFMAQPREHIFLKPNVTRRAAEAYGFDFAYQSRPDWPTYSDLLEFAATVKRDLKDMRPRDLIDIQSFIWVQGSRSTSLDFRCRSCVNRIAAGRPAPPPSPVISCPFRSHAA